MPILPSAPTEKDKQEAALEDIVKKRKKEIVTPRGVTAVNQKKRKTIVVSQDDNSQLSSGSQDRDSLDPKKKTHTQETIQKTRWWGWKWC